jgi:hypothetical protein
MRKEDCRAGLLFFRFRTKRYEIDGWPSVLAISTKGQSFASSPLSFVIIMLALSFVIISCHNNETEPATSELKLIADDVGVTEVWLRLNVSDRVSQGTLSVTRDDSTIFLTDAIRSDTLVYCTSLLPNHSYEFKAKLTTKTYPFNLISSVVLTTLDTTSHNFTWRIDTLGDGNSSTLNDVVIVNDTLAYAVGEIYLNDSAGHVDPAAYCVAIWNGTSWKLKRLYYGGTNLIVSVRGICVFNKNDIWLAAGSIFHWDGLSTQTELRFSRLALPDPNGTVEKLWGMTSSDLYGVGNAGTVVHNGTGSWQIQESGTRSAILNIWGNARTILAVTGDKRILRLSTSSVQDTLAWGGDYIRGIWLDEPRPVYLSGTGVWRHDEALWREMSGLSVQFYTGVRGDGSNNIFAIGWGGMVVHFNGVTWHRFPELSDPSWEFEALAVGRNAIAAVGFEGVSIGGRAIVALGKNQ